MGVTQYNRTDLNAKVMVKLYHNLMAYNTQVAVDNKYKFIIATDVSSEGSDKHQLHNMAIKSKEIINNQETTIVADGGYYDGNEIKKSLFRTIKQIPLSWSHFLVRGKEKVSGEKCFNYVYLQL